MFKSGAWFFLFGLLAIGACKNTAKKPSGASKGSERRKQEQLAQALGIPVDHTSNIRLLESVAGWMGVPYKDNMCSKEGTDCSGFVQAVYKEAYGRAISRNTTGMHKETKRVEKSNLREGDLVFFSIQGKKVSHVGIYLRDNKFAHASSSKGVTINDLSEKYYATWFTGGGRYN